VKYMTTVMTTNPAEAGEPPAELMGAIGALGMEAAQAGILVSSGGMGLDSTIVLADDEISVVDGPYAESKELVGGFATYELPSREQAIEWARRFAELHRVHWPGWEGRIEITALVDMAGG
jgi:hypothetical protein